MTEMERLRAQEIERSVIFKVLIFLAPFLALLYVFNLLDRNNVSIAALTMQKALHFSDREYGFGAGIFYVGYFLFEIPSNLIMERVGARRWIARIMITWGIVSTAMMFIRTPWSFYGLRILLGVAEAGFYPGIVLYLTYWVPSTARARVLSTFLSLTAILGLFGGPLGGQLIKLQGFHLAGWQWLFLLEGVPSIVFGIIVFCILPDRPAQAGWLTPEEKEWITARLAEDAKNEQRVPHMSWRVALSEPRIVLMCLIFIVTSTGGNAIGFFGPQLIKSRSGGIWSDTKVATILFIPALVGAISMFLASFHSDRTGRRRRHVTLGYLVAGLGFLLCVYAPNVSWVVAALALNTLGERAAAGSYWALTTNLLGARAAAAGIAFINSVGNLGGFFGPILMGELKTRSHGGYTAGLYTAAALMILGGILAYMLRGQPGSGSGLSQEASEEERADDIAAIAQPDQHIP